MNERDENSAAYERARKRVETSKVGTSTSSSMCWSTPA